MSVRDRKLSRRALLRAGLGLAMTGLGWARYQQPEPLRIGFVLPDRSERARLDRNGGGIAGEAARRGAVLAEERLGDRFPGLDLRFASAPDASAAERAGRRLVQLDGVRAVIGGIGAGQDLSLSGLAVEAGALFVNIGSAGDELRVAGGDHVLHIEATDTDYLEAMFGYYRSNGVGEMTLVADAAHERLAGRAERLASETGLAPRISWAPSEPAFAPLVAGLAGRGPQLVVLLLDWRGQLEFQATYEAAGAGGRVVGFPFPVAQSREYYLSLARAAPSTGTSPRVALWDASLPGEEASTLAADYLARWGLPMDPSSWAAFAAVHLLAQAHQESGSAEPAVLRETLLAGQGWRAGKDQVLTFDERGQLRQPLYLVELDPQAGDRSTVARVLNVAE